MLKHPRIYTGAALLAAALLSAAIARGQERAEETTGRGSAASHGPALASGSNLDG